MATGDENVVTIRVSSMRGFLPNPLLPVSLTSSFETVYKHVEEQLLAEVKLIYEQTDIKREDTPSKFGMSGTVDVTAEILTDPSHLFRSTDIESECPCCLVQYEKTDEASPTKTCCGHWICQNCLEKCARTGTAKGFPCPIHPSRSLFFRWNDGTVADLSLLADLAMMIQSGQFKCADPECPNPAVYWCEECNGMDFGYQCKKCCDDNHQTRMMKRHKVKPLTAAPLSKEDICPDHGEKRLFAMKMESEGGIVSFKLVCPLCLTKDGKLCLSGDAEKVEIVAKRASKMLTTMVSEDFEEKYSEAMMCALRLEEQFRTMVGSEEEPGTASEAKRAIRSFFDELHAILNASCTKLETAVDEETEKRIQVFEGLHRQTAEVLGTVRHAMAMRQLLDDSSSPQSILACFNRMGDAQRAVVPSLELLPGVTFHVDLPVPLIEHLQLESGGAVHPPLPPAPLSVSAIIRERDSTVLVSWVVGSALLELKPTFEVEILPSSDSAVETTGTTVYAGPESSAVVRLLKLEMVREGKSYLFRVRTLLAASDACLLQGSGPWSNAVEFSVPKGALRHPVLGFRQEETALAEGFDVLTKLFHPLEKCAAAIGPKCVALQGDSYRLKDGVESGTLLPELSRPFSKENWAILSEKLENLTLSVLSVSGSGVQDASLEQMLNWREMAAIDGDFTALGLLTFRAEDANALLVKSVTGKNHRMFEGLLKLGLVTSKIAPEVFSAIVRTADLDSLSLFVQHTNTSEKDKFLSKTELVEAYFKENAEIDSGWNEPVITALLLGNPRLVMELLPDDKRFFWDDVLPLVVLSNLLASGVVEIELIAAFSENASWASAEFFEYLSKMLARPETGENILGLLELSFQSGIFVGGRQLESVLAASLVTLFLGDSKPFELVFAKAKDEDRLKNALLTFTAVFSSIHAALELIDSPLALLEKVPAWLEEAITQQNDPFVQACLRFAKELLPAVFSCVVELDPKHWTKVATQLADSCSAFEGNVESGKFGLALAALSGNTELVDFFLRLFQSAFEKSSNDESWGLSMFASAMHMLVNNNTFGSLIMPEFSRIKDSLKQLFPPNVSVLFDVAETALPLFFRNKESLLPQWLKIAEHVFDCGKDSSEDKCKNIVFWQWMAALTGDVELARIFLKKTPVLREFQNFLVSDVSIPLLAGLAALRGLSSSLEPAVIKEVCPILKEAALAALNGHPSTPFLRSCDFAEILLTILGQSDASKNWLEIANISVPAFLAGLEGESRESLIEFTLPVSCAIATFFGDPELVDCLLAHSESKFTKPIAGMLLGAFFLQHLSAKVDIAQLVTEITPMLKEIFSQPLHGQIIDVAGLLLPAVFSNPDLPARYERVVQVLARHIQGPGAVVDVHEAIKLSLVEISRSVPIPGFRIIAAIQALSTVVGRPLPLNHAYSVVRTLSFEDAEEEWRFVWEFADAIVAQLLAGYDGEATVCWMDLLRARVLDGSIYGRNEALAIVCALGDVESAKVLVSAGTDAQSRCKMLPRGQCRALTPHEHANSTDDLRGVFGSVLNSDDVRRRLKKNRKACAEYLRLVQRDGGAVEL